MRKHLQFTEEHKERLAEAQKTLGFCGEMVNIDKNVEFMRFPNQISVDNNAVIKEGTRICACNETATVSIGENTTVGYHTFIFATASVEIGANCLIAPFVYIVDSDHGIELDTLINQQPNITAPIKIGDDVWIGTGAKILKGVTIGTGAVIAAGAIVKDDVAPYKIVGGIPAKVISERK